MSTNDFYLPLDIEARFPNLKRSEYRKTSEKNIVYNCIAHAAEVDTLWWWPSDDIGVYWPSGAQKEETIDSFVQAYAEIGYKSCDNREIEPGFCKIAIYVDEDGNPTHAARQLPCGEWTSKLGRSEDIQHRTLEAVGDQHDGSIGYGRVAVLMKRPASNPGH